LNQRTIKQLSSLMSMICMTLIFILPISTIWFWSNFESYSQYLGTAIQDVLQIDTIQNWQIVFAAIYSLCTSFIVVYALTQLRRLFINFRNNDFFTKDSVISMHRFCLALFVSALFKVINPMVLSVLLTLNNRPNEKALVVSFGSNEFWLLFTAATFLVISWSFKEGLNLANENASFV